MVRWCRLKDEQDLRDRLDRLCQQWGMLPKYPNDRLIRKRLPVLADYRIKHGRLWYQVDSHYVVLPNNDRYFMPLNTFYDALGDRQQFHDALGDRQRFRELMHAAAKLGREQNEQSTRQWYQRHRPKHYK